MKTFPYGFELSCSKGIKLSRYAARCSTSMSYVRCITPFWFPCVVLLRSLVAMEFLTETDSGRTVPFLPLLSVFFSRRCAVVRPPTFNWYRRRVCPPRRQNVTVHIFLAGRLSREKSKAFVCIYRLCSKK